MEVDWLITRHAEWNISFSGEQTGLHTFFHVSLNFRSNIQKFLLSNTQLENCFLLKFNMNSWEKKKKRKNLFLPVNRATEIYKRLFQWSRIILSPAWGYKKFIISFNGTGEWVCVESATSHQHFKSLMLLNLSNIKSIWGSDVIDQRGWKQKPACFVASTHKTINVC